MCDLQRPPVSADNISNLYSYCINLLIIYAYISMAMLFTSCGNVIGASQLHNGINK